MLFYCQGNLEFLKTKAPFYVARYFGQLLRDLTVGISNGRILMFN
jgi:hypothetical protein